MRVEIEVKYLSLHRKPSVIIELALKGPEIVQIITCTCTVFIDNFRNISANSLI